MRKLLATLALAALAPAAHAVDIVDVLRRSQQQRLDAMPAATDPERAAVLRASFESLRRHLAPDIVAELRIVSGPVLAETLHGHIVVVNESLAALPEGVRSFVMAHELGHVVHQHWLQVGLLYQRYVPGEVVPETTDPVAGVLGRAASGQAHRHEFEADAYALGALRRLGLSPQDAFGAFITLGMQQDTATHPGTRKRIAFLRAVESGVALPSGGDAE